MLNKFEKIKQAYILYNNLVYLDPLQIMALVYRLLFKQLYNMYKRQGALALSGYLVKSFGYLTIDRYLRGSFSQKGEDLIIDRYFKNKRKGFYIDIGAYHPQINSNTKLFYDRGWNGINIEPNPARIELFQRFRKRDKNLNVGIGSSKGMATFYELDANGLSTFSKKEADSMLKLGHKLKNKMKIQMYKMQDIMKEYVRSDIDFITIDTEALDLEVLKSNNWEKYRPKLLCIETIDFADLLTSTKDSSDRKREISKYLSEKGYKEYFSNGLNTLYIDSKQKSVITN